MHRSNILKPIGLGLIPFLVLISVLASVKLSQAASATPVKISMSSASDGNVGTGFAGFSYEKDRIGAGMFDVSNTNLVNLFKLLGPSVLRVGGNLVDIVKWNPAGSGGSVSEIV